MASETAYNFGGDQDYHEQQCTVELRCSGDDDALDPHPNSPFATGLYVTCRGKKYLVTNWHVVSGKNPETDKQIGAFIPRVLFVRETVSQLGKPVVNRLPLYHEGNALWIEGASQVTVESWKQRIDLALVPVPKADGPIGINLDDPQKPIYVPRPLDQVFIIGFPFIRENPIWKTGHIAESIRPGCEYFLVNGRTKRGMSGSGVFSTSVRTCDNKTHLSNNLLLGIYSGRYDDVDLSPSRKATEKELNELDLGIVWKVSLIRMILEKKV